MSEPTGTSQPAGTPPPGEAPPRGRSRRRAASRIALVLALSGGVWVALFMPRMRERQQRAAMEAAGKDLYTLCTNVTALHDETGQWTSAGPLPAAVPRGETVPFPADATFEQLQFQPRSVRYQYQVVVESTESGDAKVRCIARGDLDGDGQTSEAVLEIDENGMMRPVRWRDALE